LLEAYAQFLDAHGDPAARGEYQKLVDLFQRNGASPSERARVLRRLVLLDLLAGDRPGAGKHAAEAGLRLPAPSAAPVANTVDIPARCVRFRAWPLFRPMPRRTTCCPRWPTTSI
jgi:hypothetical protein